MEKKKLISAKISPKTLEDIDEFLKNHRYWKRNTVISGILDAVVDNFTKEEICKMVSYDRLNRRNINAHFS